MRNVTLVYRTSSSSPRLWQSASASIKRWKRTSTASVGEFHRRKQKQFKRNSGDRVLFLCRLRRLTSKFNLFQIFNSFKSSFCRQNFTTRKFPHLSNFQAAASQPAAKVKFLLSCNRARLSNFLAAGIFKNFFIFRSWKS